MAAKLLLVFAAFGFSQAQHPVATGDLVAREKSAFYVSERMLSKLLTKLAPGANAPIDDAEVHTLFSDQLPDDESMVPVDISGTDFNSLAKWVQQRGMRGTVEAVVAARWAFSNPSVPQVLTAAVWRRERGIALVPPLALPGPPAPSLPRVSPCARTILESVCLPTPPTFDKGGQFAAPLGLGYALPAYPEQGYALPAYPEQGYALPAYPEQGYALPAYPEQASPCQPCGQEGSALPAYPEQGYALPAYPEQGYALPAYPAQGLGLPAFPGPLQTQGQPMPAAQTQWQPMLDPRVTLLRIQSGRSPDFPQDYAPLYTEQQTQFYPQAGNLN